MIGAQQQIPQQGVLTVNGIYNYTPMRLLNGTTGVIPAADQARQRLILGHHQEVRTITQTYTLDLNYGVTDRLAVEFTLPYLKRKHQHIDGLGESATEAGEPVNFSDNGIGDMRVMAKYKCCRLFGTMSSWDLALSFPLEIRGPEIAQGRSWSLPDNWDAGMWD